MVITNIIIMMNIMVIQKPAALVTKFWTIMKLTRARPIVMILYATRTIRIWHVAATSFMIMSSTFAVTVPFIAGCPLRTLAVARLRMSPTQTLRVARVCFSRNPRATGFAVAAARTTWRRPCAAVTRFSLSWPRPTPAVELCLTTRKYKHAARTGVFGG